MKLESSFWTYRTVFLQTPIAFCCDPGATGSSFGTASFKENLIFESVTNKKNRKAAFRQLLRQLLGYSGFTQPLYGVWRPLLTGWVTLHCSLWLLGFAWWGSLEKTRWGLSQGGNAWENIFKMKKWPQNSCKVQRYLRKVWPEQDMGEGEGRAEQRVIE